MELLRALGLHQRRRDIPDAAVLDLLRLDHRRRALQDAVALWPGLRRRHVLELHLRRDAVPDPVNTSNLSEKGLEITSKLEDCL